MTMTRYTIYWLTRDVGVIDRIRRRFGITEGMTVNGENTVSLHNAKDADDLQACALRGLIQIRNKPTKQ